MGWETGKGWAGAGQGEARESKGVVSVSQAWDISRISSVLSRQEPEGLQNATPGARGEQCVRVCGEESGGRATHGVEWEETMPSC